MNNLNIHINIFFIFAISILGGLFGAKIFKKLKIPQVLGYIVAGIILGKSGFRIINENYLETFKTFNFFALGIIGFLVGGELYLKDLKKYAKQYTSILLCEGMLSFFLTGFLCSLIFFYVTKNLSISISAGIIIGAIASATDPASTMSVIWEYRSRGILTNTISSIIALDDVLAMTLYGISVGVAKILISSNSNIIIEIIKVFYELGGSIILGFLMGVFSNYILKNSENKNNTSSIIIGSLILITSLAQMLHFDIILSSLSAGIFIINFAPQRSKTIFKTVKTFSSPIYVLFFVIVGANLQLAGIPGWLWWVIILYVIGRNTGKIIGSNIGSRISKAPAAVRKFTGFGLFAQGGAAIGLAIMAGYHLQDIKFLNYSLGNLVVTCITATTFLIQIIGPLMVKMSIIWADEAFRDITEEDIILKHTCGEMLDKNISVLNQSDPLKKVFEIISEQDQILFPVINSQKIIIGYISLELIRNLLIDRDTWQWLLAGDVCVEYTEKIYQNSPLQDVINIFNYKNLDRVIILLNPDKHIPIGIINKSKLYKSINFEIIKKRDAKI